MSRAVPATLLLLPLLACLAAGCGGSKTGNSHPGTTGTVSLKLKKAG